MQKKCKKIKYKKVRAPYGLLLPCWVCTSHKFGYSTYPHTSISGKDQTIARYMYEKYKGKITEGLLIRHKCDNPACVNPDHLELGTKEDNAQDRDKRGRNGMAKLLPDEIAEIRSRISKGESQVTLANEYGVSKATISQLKSGNAWKGVKGVIDKTDARKSLTVEQVSGIKKALNDGASCAALARKYGVNKTTINHIKTERNWKEIEPRIEVKIKVTLTEDKVRRIKIELLKGRTQKDIAKEFNIARTTVGAIKSGRNWTMIRVE